MTREEAIEYLKRADITVGQTIKTMTAEALEMAIEALQKEPCEDAISRQEVLEEINRIGINAFVTYNDYSGLFDFVDTLPSVTPQPKMGTWIFHKPFDNEHKNCNECIECSQCHTWLGHDCYSKTPYCPMCGAKMERDEMEYKTIDNPCYHCYAGAIGECVMIGCKHLLNSWSQDLESETIEILNIQAEGSDKE